MFTVFLHTAESELGLVALLAIAVVVAAVYAMGWFTARERKSKVRGKQ